MNLKKLNQLILDCESALEEVNEKLGLIKLGLSQPIEPHILESTTENEIVSTRDEIIPSISHRAKVNGAITKYISSESKFLHHNQIYNGISKDFSEIPIERLRQDVSSCLSLLKEQGALIKFSAGGANRNSFWGLQSWLGEDKKPKTKHMYDPKFLTSNHKDHPVNLK